MKKKLRVSVAALLTLILLIGSAVPCRINAEDTGDLTVQALSFSREYRDGDEHPLPIEVTNKSDKNVTIVGTEITGADQDVFIKQDKGTNIAGNGGVQSVVTVALKPETKVRFDSSHPSGYGKYTATLIIKYTKEGESEVKEASQAIAATVTPRPVTVDAGRLLVDTVKTYDGRTTLTTGASASYLSELFSGDSVSLATIKASFDSPGAGTEKTITAEYTWIGDDIPNYQLPTGGTTNGEIVKATGQAVFEVYNMQEGGTLRHTLTSSTNNAAAATITYKPKDQPDSDYTATAPTAVGVYVAKAVIPESNNYKQVDVTSEFAIYSNNSDLALSARPLTGRYGEAGSAVPLTLQNKGSDALTDMTFALDTEGQQAFTIEGASGLTSMGANTTDSTTVKVNLKNGLRTGNYVGSLTASYKKGGVTYVSQVQLSATVSGRTLTFSNDLESNSKVYDGNTGARAGEIRISGLIGGDDVNARAIANYDTPDAGTNKKITIDYYVWGADVGCYNFPDQRIVTDGIIEKAEGKGTVVIGTTYRGEKIKPVLTSETNDIHKVTMYYKEDGAPDSSYSTNEPAKTGTFKAKAVFAATNNYKETTAETVFKVTELDSDQTMYSIEGKQGNNGFYGSDVIITGKGGYLVSMEDNGLYTTGLTISESRGPWTLYLKHQETGVKPKPIELPQMKIDKTAPKITGASNGDTINSEKVRLTVSDTYLDKVLVNGKNQDFQGKQAVISLERGKKIAEYTIEAYDQCGNATTLKFTINGKSQRINGSGIVTLEEGVEYQFGTGTWKISGDDTLYRGDSSFYVYSSGQYNVIKQ